MSSLQFFSLFLRGVFSFFVVFLSKSLRPFLNLTKDVTGSSSVFSHPHLASFKFLIEVQEKCEPQENPEDFLKNSRLLFSEISVQKDNIFRKTSTTHLTNNGVKDSDF